ncbi:putative esterase [Algibacter lectus]|uniref:Putative esterase n=1 Tax=Algibacter lectus TaxID=221126 RepID=A0A090WUB7_9FLAO|nr:alpha/beta hydrolase-fold protein [Algibacter lectus]GAL80596.1 putative esterase [Algibacter lectus]
MAYGGDGSAYLPHNSKNFENWIVEDVNNAIIENIDCTSTKSNLFISGLSMGGYGALRLGAKHTETYSAISGHSSITDITQMHLFVEEDEALYTEKEQTETSVFDMMLSNKNNLPPTRFDCGKDDLLIEHNRKLHNQLIAQKIPHVYEEFEGAHEWPYWQEHIKKSLLFFNNINT